MRLPPVHITKSKVDYHVQEELDEIADMIQHRPPNPDFNYPILASENSTSSNATETSTAMKSPAVTTLKESTIEATMTPELEGLYNRDHALIKGKVCAFILYFECFASCHYWSLHGQFQDKMKNKAKHQESSESESTSILRTLLTCPVCLDIFFSPFMCKPCGHAFCETCLRRIALPRPTQTACPLCRQLIYSCEIHKGN